jgi:PAS domain S-box-containing protein
MPTPRREKPAKRPPRRRTKASALPSQLAKRKRTLAESERRCRQLAAANLALQESEARFRQLFEAASDWFWEADAKGYLTYVSPNYQAIYGHAIAEILGKRLNEVPGVTIAPHMAQKALTAIKARQPYRDYIYSYQPLPGDKKRWITTNCFPVFGEDGDFQGYRGVSRNITAQVEAELALRESEQRFRQLFEIGADYYWEMDADYRMSHVSPNYEAVVGVPAAHALGKRFAETPGVRVEPEMGKMALLAQKEKKPYRDFVYSRKLPNGEIRWFSVSAVPIFGDDGEFRGFRGIAANITTRMEAEAAARLAQRRLHDAVAYVTQPFVVYDVEDRVVAFNQAFVDLHTVPDSNTPVCSGVSARELAKWQVRMRFCADGPGEPPVDLETLLAHHQTEQEHAYHLRDGRWMLMVHRRLPGGGRVGLWTDITAIKRAEAERRELEEQLHHSQRLEALGTLAGGVAHEINNALVPVIALTKMMAGKQLEGSRERRNLDIVSGAAERSRDLVKQILAFSRKEDEKRREDVDLAKVLHDALGLLRATVPASIRIEETIAPTSPLNADPAQLQQVIVNLVTNAAQAIGETMGTIIVSLRPQADGAHLCLSVADSGCGMDEATKARIFEPFFTTKAVGKGTGLGLAVVHGIIKDHGGRIEVESAPGHGTRFDVILPIQRTATGAAA